MEGKLITLIASKVDELSLTIKIQGAVIDDLLHSLADSIIEHRKNDHELEWKFILLHSTLSEIKEEYLKKRAEQIEKQWKSL